MRVGRRGGVCHEWKDFDKYVLRAFANMGFLIVVFIESLDIDASYKRTAALAEVHYKI